MTIVGILFIVSAIVAGFILIIKFNKSKLAICTISGLAVFAGCFFILQERITKLTIKGVGTIIATAEQIQIDAETIAELKNRIQNQSATIDIVSRKAIEAESQLTSLDSTINLANFKIDEINEITDISLLILGAQNDYRFAFDTLKIMSQDTSYNYGGLAGQAYYEIMDKHDGHYTKYPPLSIDLSVMNIDELYGIYKSFPVYGRTAIIAHIWERKNILIIDKMDFLIFVMKEGESLKAIELAGLYFSEKSKQKYKPLATYRFFDWWQNNREKYLDK